MVLVRWNGIFWLAQKLIKVTMAQNTNIYQIFGLRSKHISHSPHLSTTIIHHRKDKYRILKHFSIGPAVHLCNFYVLCMKSSLVIHLLSFYAVNHNALMFVRFDIRNSIEIILNGNEMRLDENVYFRFNVILLVGRFTKILNTMKKKKKMVWH